MWQCEEDIVKDLALLNDFGTPGDTEPYKVLCSSGRGSGLLQKKDHSKFVCPRSGEIIQIDDSDKGDNQFRSRGRGSSLARSLKSNYQLQKQLRLARPLGSGDEAIESYCRRNWPCENSTDKASTSQATLEINYSDSEVDNTIRKSDFPRKFADRIKGVRSSSSKSNALISSLLSKSESCSEVNGKKIPTEQEYNSTNGKISDSTSSEEETDTNGMQDEVRRDINEIDILEESSVKKFEFDNNDCTNNDYDIKYDSIDLNVAEEPSTSKGSSSEVNIHLINSFKSDSNSNQSPKQNNEQNEIYRKLGERLNNAKKIKGSSDEARSYDFSPLYNYVPSFADCTDGKLIMCYNSAETDYQFHEDDFPTL